MATKKQRPMTIDEVLDTRARLLFESVEKRRSDGCRLPRITSDEARLLTLGHMLKIELTLAQQNCSGFIDE